MFAKVIYIQPIFCLSIIIVDNSYKSVKDNSHDKNAIHVCKYVLNYIRNRQRTMGVKDLYQNRIALLEEYREWISEGINQDYVLYLISRNEISDIN